jgi:hypothetical protein
MNTSIKESDVPENDQSHMTTERKAPNYAPNKNVKQM